MPPVKVLVKIGLWEFEVMAEFTSTMKGNHVFKITSPKGFENFRIKIKDVSEMKVLELVFRELDKHPGLPYKKWTEQYRKLEPESVVEDCGVVIEEIEEEELEEPEIELTDQELKFAEKHAKERTTEALRALAKTGPESQRHVFRKAIKLQER